MVCPSFCKRKVLFDVASLFSPRANGVKDFLEVEPPDSADSICWNPICIRQPLDMAIGHHKSDSDVTDIAVW